MKKIAFLALVFVMLPGGFLQAQQIAGDWQGTLKTGSQEYRFFLQVAKEKDSSWRATLLNMGRGREAISVNSIVLQDSDVKITITAAQASFEGKISADGNAISGIWTQDKKPTPLEFQRPTEETAWQRTHYVTVDLDVTLEVVDWGGSGRPLILLPGLGNTAHIFDSFAAKLTPVCHVYGITRRGFGISSIPESGYSSERLGDDVLVVIRALKLDRPILAGHSIGGSELSSVGSRHPEMVSGLIYLDAAYIYAFYDTSQEFDGVMNMSQSALVQMQIAKVQEPRNMVAAGIQKWTEIKAPALAIYADHHSPGSKIPEAQAFEKGVPSSKIIILRNADHALFFSSEEDVLREMKAFIAGLP